MSCDNLVDLFTDHLELVNDIDEGVCDECKGNEYSDFSCVAGSIPAELNASDDLANIFAKIACEVRTFLIVNREVDSELFEALRQKIPRIKKLTVFLGFWIDNALKSERTKEELFVSLSAADLYFALCKFKSARLYNLFDINIFQKCVNILKLTEKVLRPLISRVANITKSRRRDPESEREDPLEIFDSANDLVQRLLRAMRSLFVVLHSSTISDTVLENDERCKVLVDFLRDVVYIDVEGSTDFQAKSIDEMESILRLSDLSFAIVQCILSKHSTVRVATISARFLMPYLLFWVCGSSKLAVSGSMPQVLRDVRDLAVHFLSSRMDNLSRLELEYYMKILKNMPAKCLDRAEYRAQVASTFVDILCLYPPMAYQLPNPPIPLNELITDEGAMGLAIEDIDDADVVGVNENMDEIDESLNEPEAQSETLDDNAEVNDDAENVSPVIVTENAQPNDELEFVKQGMTAKQAMLMLIVGGLVDKFAKYKALQAVENMFIEQSCVDDLCHLAKKFVDENYEELNLRERLPPVKAESEEMNAELSMSIMSAVVTVNTNAPDDLLWLILKSFDDEKAIVAKQSLSTCVVVLNNALVTNDILLKRCVEEIRQKTWDTGIQVRKQAAVCLRNLLASPLYGCQRFVEEAWLSGILHQVVDNEQSIAQQAIKFVTEYIVNGLLQPRPNPTWELMDVVENESEYTRYLAICLTEHMNNQNIGNKLGSNSLHSMISELVRKLQIIATEDDCPASAWLLLSELSYRMNVDASCAEKYWVKLRLNDPSDRVPSYVAKIIANRCDHLKPEGKCALKNQISKQLRANSVAVPHIAAVCYTFVCLCNGTLPNGGKGNTEGIAEVANFVEQYGKIILRNLDDSICIPLMSRISSRNAFTPAESQHLSQHTPKLEQVMRSIYTIGELCQYAPGKVNAYVFNVLRATVAADKIQECADGDPERPVSEAVNENELPYLAPPSVSSPQRFSQFDVKPSVISRGVRAAAVLALGKMSIVDEKIGKKVIPVLIRQLKVDTDHCVRNIILIILADICTMFVYVNLYGPIIASSMRDPSVIVRRHAIFLVTTLIRDEYFKWSGQVMYFYLGSLLDQEVTIREQIQASLLNVLLPKFPNMLINRFVEAMFHLNDVVHPAMAVLIKQEQETCPLAKEDRFSLHGESRAESRMKIYKFLISTFTDAQNLPLMCRIATEVFEAVADESLDLSEPNVENLLLDALAIIRCREIVLRLQSGKKNTAEELEEETEEARELAAAATDVITFVFMRTINNDVISRLFKLKDYIRAKEEHSNLARICHSTILDLFETYKDHFDALVGNDQQHREEMENDLERIRGVKVTSNPAPTQTTD